MPLQDVMPFPEIGPSLCRGPESQKTEQGVSKTEGDLEMSLDAPQEVVDTPAIPGKPSFFPHSPVF